MIVVTGGAGFIGSNIVAALNERGHSDVLVVDDLSDGHKFLNIADLQLGDYMDLHEFRQRIANKTLPAIEAIFHEGACSTTTEWDGRYMMDNNYSYSKELLHYCSDHKIPLIYASSAATYGGSSRFVEEPSYEKPLNVYGYSKLLFDQYVRRVSADLQCQYAGLRYFNVYGPREQHKGGMASVAYHFNNQIKENGRCKLFEGTEGYGNGEQLRDFVYVGDVVAVNLWLLDNPEVSGIFNCGTGRSQAFNDVANAVIDWHGKGDIEYIPFPDKLKGAYQSFTEADLTNLRTAGCLVEFNTVEQGTKSYLDWLNQAD